MATSSSSNGANQLPVDIRVCAPSARCQDSARTGSGRRLMVLPPPGRPAVAGGRPGWMLAATPSDARQLPGLGQPDAVPRRVAKRRVDAVGTLLRLLDELHATTLELLVRQAAILGREEDGPREAL